MAMCIKPPEDPKIVQVIMKYLVKEKLINMGADTATMYCMVKDENGNLRLPFGFCLDLWNVPLPRFDQLPRHAFMTNIVLGEGGRVHQPLLYNQMVKSLVETRRCFLSLFCGGGKTIMAIKAIVEMGIIGGTAVVTDGTLIFPQWLSVLRSATNLRVAGIDSSVDVLPEADVYVMMITACRRMKAKALERIKFLIVDEATYFMTVERIPGLLNFTPMYCLGLCAEIKRDDKMECFLPYFFGNNIIRLISQNPFIVYRLETNYVPIVQTHVKTKKMDWNLVLSSIAENEPRNLDILWLVHHKLKTSKIIIGVKRVEQAVFLHECLIKLGEKAAILVRNMKSFSSCRILVGVYAKMGKGVDAKNLCADWEGDVFDVAILAADCTNPEQFVGRVFRHKNPVVYDMVDNNSTLRKHFDKNRLPWYTARKGQIVKEGLEGHKFNLSMDEEANLLFN